MRIYRERFWGILFLALLVGLFALMRGLGVTGSRRVPMGRVRSF